MDLNNLKSFFRKRRGLVYFVLTLIIFHFVNLKYSLHHLINTSTIFLIFFVIFGVLFLIFAVVDIVVNKRIETSKILGYLSIVCLITVFTGFYSSEFQAYLSKKKAVVITEALKKFNEKNNYYPKNISELSPEYLETIPTSYMGWFNEPYEYSYDEKDGYSLTFPSYDGGYYLIRANSNENRIERY